MRSAAEDGDSRVRYARELRSEQINRYKTYYDARRLAVSLFDPSAETFYTYDNPHTAWLKMLYIDATVLIGLGGVRVGAEGR